MAEHFIPRSDAETDLLSCAAYLAESIQSNDGRAQAMTAVVPAYLAKGEVDLAAELANTVEDPYVRDRLLIAVAETCAAVDDDEYALQLVEAMDDPGMQAQGRERIGLTLASIGSIEKARTVADEMDHRDNVLAGIAIRQHSDGKTSEALTTIAEIGYPTAAAHAFVAMSAGSIDKEQFDDAVDLLEKAITPADEIEHEEERIRTLVDIGNSFVAAKRNDRAIETLDKAREYAEVLDNIHRDSFLASVSVGFLRTGSVELADRTLDAVADKTQIATALLGFAREFWRRDEKDDALESLDEGYAILKSQHEKETRDSKAKFALFTNIAAQYAGFEKGERAIEIAQEIEDEEQSVNALAQIARIMAVQKNEEVARLALNTIADDAQKVFALIALSDVAFANQEIEKAASLLDEANALTEEVPQLVSRASAYIGIAQRLAKLEREAQFDEAIKRTLKTTSEIRDESAKVSALTELSILFDDLGISVPENEIDTLKSLLTKASVRSF